MADHPLSAGITWPVDPAVLPGFLLAMALIELTPGPNMGYLAVVTAARGRIAGVLTVLGITASLAFYLALTTFGLTWGVLISPIAMGLLRWGGVLYLLVLALEALRPAASISVANSGAGRLVLRGLIANLLNPKALLFYAVLLPGFVRPGFSAPVTQLLTLGLGHVAVSIAVHLSIVLGVSGLVSTWPPNRLRLLRWTSAAGLAGVAFWLALSA